MDTFFSYFEQMNNWQIVLVGLSVVVLWFLPAVVALFFNRKHLKLIMIACVPAGFSVIAWSALMVWAFTGKVWSKHKLAVQNQEQ